MRGMDMKQIRRANLRRLITEAGSVKEVAESAGTDPNYLSALASDNPPKTQSGRPRGVGDALARKLEKAAGKPPGWLDSLHQWGPMEIMWMDLFSKLPEDRQREAIEFLEFLTKKEGNTAESGQVTNNEQESQHQNIE